MSLFDEFFEQKTPTKIQPGLCVDEVAKDNGKSPEQFREDTRKSLFIPGQTSAEDIDRAFMDSVRHELSGQFGETEANRRIDLFEQAKHCR